jgi:hypothetical protein
MDRLRAGPEPMAPQDIRSFRRLHVAGMAMNFAQLIAICFGMARMGI